MRVEVQGGPQDGQVYPYIRSGAEYLRIKVGGQHYKLPIYFVWLSQKNIAKWSERKEVR